jgi:hypothetical protein
MSDLATQIALAHADRNEVPELCRLLLCGSVIIVGSWVDAEGTQILIQDFRVEGQAFIPFFSDDGQFWSQLGSTPYVNKGLCIECQSFVTLLRGDEWLVLNPGSPAPVALARADFEPFLRPEGAEGMEETPNDEC